ncbi:MAG TPA: hypothetical protein VMC08_10835, partial [Bacteroidales bacterium]|nr:hypothetical protein [Bacteroidales bacterium]
MARTFLSLTLILLSLFSLKPGKSPGQDVQILDLGGKWKFRKAGTVDWMDARVPGCVHLDLMSNHRIPDPFYRDNESKLQWIGEIGWEYKRDFTVRDTLLRKPHVELVCKGLDTYANVYINDSLVIVADNMFRDWYADIRRYLRPGENTIRIRFPAIVQENRVRYAQLGYKLPGDDKVVCRKAAYHFGWDWGPTFITSGIWRPIYIRTWDYLNLLGVQYIQNKVTDTVADLTAVFTVLSTVEDTCDIRIRNGPHILAKFPYPVKKGVNYIRVNFFIPYPQRWWPNGLGEPHLYTFTHEIVMGRRYRVTGTTRLGLRKLELVQTPDSIGRSFYFRVNGVPVFMKGANYIPQDNFLPRVKDSSYRALIREAAEAHMNMLRVWGGGLYENDLFYDLCDENGILVWQDFMFACALYPDDMEFSQNVRMEAVQNVVRLRNHACLALWCGNNEIDEGWKNWGWQKQYGYTPDDSIRIWRSYLSLFQNLLYRVVVTYDSLTPYISTSPRYGWGRPESTRVGDMHYWGVWWGKEPFAAYRSRVGRFMS